MATNTTEAVVLDAAAGDKAELVQQLRGYSDLFVNGLYLIIVGVLLVYLLHKFASKFIYTRVRNRLLIRVVFGFLYTAVMVVAVLLAMGRIGFDVSAISKLAFLVLTLGAVAAYFLAPFFPRLPFTLGNMVEVNGVLGVVDSISQIHTMIRKLDGTIVFIPNPVVLSSKILNFSTTPTRRVEFAISVNNDSDFEETKALLIGLMREDERVLDAPAPPAAFVVNVTASGVDMFAFCWVNNADWFGARSDLWLKILAAIEAHERVSLSLPQQEVFVKQ